MKQLIVIERTDRGRTFQIEVAGQPIEIAVEANNSEASAADRRRAADRERKAAKRKKGGRAKTRKVPTSVSCLRCPGKTFGSQSEFMKHRREAHRQKKNGGRRAAA